MASLDQLEASINDLSIGAKTLIDHLKGVKVGTGPQLLVPPDIPSEVHRARRNLLANVARLQVLLTEPTDFIQQLASQNQILACLQWLGEFQVLACIPLDGSVPIKDVADLADVPVSLLCKVARMMATAGFLSEPQTGQIAHTPLSAPFVTKLCFLDAAMFLAGTAAPIALQMATATQRYGRSANPSESAYNIAFHTSQTFKTACEQQIKLQSQWSAYLQCAGDTDHSVTEILSRLDWRNLGNACIVDIGPRSTKAVVALADLYPALRFVIQMSESASLDRSVEVGRPRDLDGRLTLQRRAVGDPQTLKDAAVFILHLPSSSPEVTSHTLQENILKELRAHLNVLRANSTATIVMMTRFLPEPGSVDPEVDAMARCWDLTRKQLANECENEVGELVEIVSNVRDSMGCLVVVNKLHSRTSIMIALAVKYQAYATRQ